MAHTRNPHARNVLTPLLAVPLLAAFVLPIPSGAAPVSLPSYRVDLAQTSVSGLSAGGYMAVQMHVAHSSIMKGVGVFAAGPYHCAEGSLLVALQRCMNPGVLYPAPTAADIARFVQYTLDQAAAGAIDDPANLARQKAWIFVGSADDVVRPEVVDTLALYYRNFMPANSIVYRTHIPTFHNQVVAEGDARIPPCNYKNRHYKNDPYVNDCDYDAAGELLQHIYGPLAPRNGGTPGGQFIEFDQHEFIDAPRRHGMDDTGWAYVPASCAAGAACKVHVAFHGCFQFTEHVQDAYIRNSGLNQWADNNGIIVLYPQTVAGPGNENGCFDWWGHTQAAGSTSVYDTRHGVQIRAIRGMIGRLAGAPGGVPAHAPPSGSAAAATTDTAATVVREFVSNAPQDGYVKAYADGSGRVLGTYASIAIGRGNDRRFSRGLLSFDTSAIPAGATVTRAYLTVTHSWSFGRPWDSPAANRIAVDVSSGNFGAHAAVDKRDWSAPASASAAASIPMFDGGTGVSGDFNAAGLAAINTGVGARTQLRLRFASDQSEPGYVRILDGTGAKLTVAYR